MQMNGETPLATFASELLPQGGEALAELAYGIDQKHLANGHATDFVYSVLSLTDRRKHGIFFSGPVWARKLIAQVDVEKWSRFLDPSVGTGDLLLEVCKELPLEKTLGETLSQWAKRLSAIDLRSSFLHIAWARIQALAFVRHQQERNDASAPVSHPLPESFRVGDALDIPLLLKSGDCVIMNPPYQRITAGSDSFVGSGKRSAAALHLERVLLEAPCGIFIVALIPDVLRSGSSYNKFRAEISKRLNIRRFDSFGGFGSDADVDVAILTGTTEELHPLTQNSAAPTYVVVGDMFAVSVGPVVPHRTPKNGEMRSYLTAKNAPQWGVLDGPVEYANYSARIEKGPFVIIRRTSSPSDKKRARATLVNYNDEVLVENHLLIARPRDGKVRTCKELINLLKKDETDAWLNEHIRCRHLTVSAIAGIPWEDKIKS